MRYFLLIFALCVVMVVVIAGPRGSTSRRPPIELFPDMVRQPKLRPQTPDMFFPDGKSSRLPIAGTIAREDTHYADLPVNTGRVTGTTNFVETSPVPVSATLLAREDTHYADLPVNTGRVTGTTNFVETSPVPVSATLLARGQQRFQINCSPCHGAQGDGNGITKKIGAMGVVANLHDKRIVELADGELFNTITYGKNLMGPYGPNVMVEDRWAIIAYVRALQLSRLGLVDDVPEQMRSTLKK